MAGRPKGSSGINRQAMLKAIELRLGKEFNPVAQMAELADKMCIAAAKNPRLAPEAITAMEKVAKYLVPQLKSVEVDISSSDGSMTPPKAIRLIPMPVPQIDSEIAQETIGDLSGQVPPTAAEVRMDEKSKAMRKKVDSAL